jgi:hypothetical protein
MAPFEYTEQTRVVLRARRVSGWRPRRQASAQDWFDPLPPGNTLRSRDETALIDDDEVFEKILRHLKLWPEQAERLPTSAGVHPYRFRR